MIQVDADLRRDGEDRADRDRADGIVVLRLVERRGRAGLVERRALLQPKERLVLADFDERRLVVERAQARL